MKMCILYNLILKNFVTKLFIRKVFNFSVGNLHTAFFAALHIFDSFNELKYHGHYFYIYILVIIILEQIQ